MSAPPVFVAVVVWQMLPARSVRVVVGIQVELLVAACVPVASDALPSVTAMVLPLATIVDAVPVAPNSRVVVT